MIAAHHGPESRKPNGVGCPSQNQSWFAEHKSAHPRDRTSPTLRSHAILLAVVSYSRVTPYLPSLSPVRRPYPVATNGPRCRRCKPRGEKVETTPFGKLRQLELHDVGRRGLHQWQPRGAGRRFGEEEERQEAQATRQGRRGRRGRKPRRRNQAPNQHEQGGARPTRRARGRQEAQEVQVGRGAGGDPLAESRH